MNIIILS